MARRATAAADKGDAETQASAPAPPSVAVNINVKGEGRERVIREPPAASPEPARGAPETPETPAEAPMLEFEEEESLDPVTQFCDEWSDGRAYQFNLIRLPDPPEYDGKFLKPCLEQIYYPRLTFRPDSLIQDIQRKMQSGGKVRVQLIEGGRYVPGGSLTFTIDDPDAAQLPQAGRAAQANPQNAAPPAPAEPSEFDKLARDLLKKKLEKLMEEPEQKPPPAEPVKSRRSDEDELTLLVAQKSDLLGNVFSRITQAVTAASANAPDRVTTFDKVVNVVGSSPVLQSRMAKTIDRLLNRFLPDKGDDKDDETEEDQMTEAADNEAIKLADYFMSACAADRPVSFDDAPVKAYSAEHPKEWGDLIKALNTYPAALIMQHFSNPAEFPEWYSHVLKAPHAKQWVESNLIAPAKASAESEKSK